MSAEFARVSPSALSETCPALRLEAGDLQRPTTEEFDAEWKFEGRLGKGGFAEVWKVRCLKDNMPYALKVLKETRSRRDRLAANLFFREAMILKAVSSSDIVSFHSLIKIPRGTRFLRNDRHVWGLLQQVCEGGAVNTKIMDGYHSGEKPYTPSDALRWSISVANALNHLHCSEPTVLHRDIKVDNILLDYNASTDQLDAKLSDFGLHQVLDERKAPTMLVRRESGASFSLAPLNTRSSKLVRPISLGMLYQSEDSTSGAGFPERHGTSLSALMHPASCPYNVQQDYSAYGTSKKGKSDKSPRDSPSAPSARGSFSSGANLLCTASGGSGRSAPLKCISLLELKPTAARAQQGTRLRRQARSSSLANECILETPLPMQTQPNAGRASAKQRSAMNMQLGESSPRASHLVQPNAMHKSSSMGGLCFQDEDLSTGYLPMQFIPMASRASAKLHAALKMPLVGSSPRASHLARPNAALKSSSTGGRSFVDADTSTGSSSRPNSRFSVMQVDSCASGNILLDRNSALSQLVSQSNAVEEGSVIVYNRLWESEGVTPFLDASYFPTAGLECDGSANEESDTVGPELTDEFYTSIASKTLQALLEQEKMGHLSNQYELDVAVYDLAFNLTGMTGSIFYMAPEVYLRQPYNEKADVFSFGVVLYELFASTLLALECMTHTTLPTPMEAAKAHSKRVSEGWRPPRMDDIPDRIWDLIQSCWQQNPGARADMAMVLEELWKIEEESDGPAPVSRELADATSNEVADATASEAVDAHIAEVVDSTECKADDATADQLDSALVKQGCGCTIC